MSEEHYIPPTISNELGRPTAEAASDRNFYARGAHTPTLFEIDGIPVTQLLEDFGSPLFVYSEHDVREKARHIREAFKSRYKKVQFAWSYKTNYLNAICRVLHQEGWIAEVVSDFEYDKAVKLGMDGPNVIYNGPFKPDETLKHAMETGAMVQVDNWDELSRIEEIVKDYNKPVEVGLRVWLDAGIRPIWSKFGFALENGEAERAAARIIQNKKLSLHTLHTHIGTYILSPDAYGVAARKLLALRQQIREDHKHKVECLNLGGGFPSQSMLHGMVGHPEEAIPPIESYAEAISSVLNGLPENDRPLLRLESGRYMVDEAGYLLTKIVALKGVSRPVMGKANLSALEHKERMILGEDAKVGYLVDAGVNLLYTSAWFSINALPARKVGPPPVPSRLYGSLCMAIDVIREQIDLPPLEVGDILTLHPVGAYNLTQSMQFINYRPAVVMITQQGEPVVIRKKETLDDIDHLEEIPAHLSKNQ